MVGGRKVEIRIKKLREQERGLWTEEKRSKKGREGGGGEKNMWWGEEERKIKNEREKVREGKYSTVEKDIDRINIKK